MAAATLERIVSEALAVDVRSCSRPQSGSVADTAICRLAEEENRNGVPPRVVCKRGGRSVWTGDVIEPQVVRLVGRETDIPVPQVLASGSCSGADERPLERWAIYEFRDGENPGSRYATLESAVRRRLVADAGSYLGRLHATAAFAFDRVGGLERRGDESGLVLSESTIWHAVDPGPPLSRLPVPLAGDDGCRPVLTHGDYQPSNLLVNGEGGVTAVLDWGNAHVTHAEYALARAEIRFVDGYRGRLAASERRQLRRTFRRSYAAHAPLEYAYDRRAPFYKLLWLAQSGANYVQIARDSRGRRQLGRQLRRL